MSDWILIDPSTEQFGRKISSVEFEFKQNTGVLGLPVACASICVNDYTKEEQMDYLSSYYSGSYEDIKKQLGDEFNWIVAECIFETDILDFI